MHVVTLLACYQYLRLHSESEVSLMLAPKALVDEWPEMSDLIEVTVRQNDAAIEAAEKATAATEELVSKVEKLLQVP